MGFCFCSAKNDRWPYRTQNSSNKRDERTFVAAQRKRYPTSAMRVALCCPTPVDKKHPSNQAPRNQSNQRFWSLKCSSFVIFHKRTLNTRKHNRKQTSIYYVYIYISLNDIYWSIDPILPNTRFQRLLLTLWYTHTHTDKRGAFLANQETHFSTDLCLKTSLAVLPSPPPPCQ